MSTVVREAQGSPHSVKGDIPREESPEYGCVKVLDVRLSEGVRWVDPDGVHVIRSTEFSLSGHGHSLSAAVEDFVNRATDLAGYVLGLAANGQTEPHEAEAARILAERLSEASDKAFAELERQRSRRVVVNFLRHREEVHTQDWRPSHRHTSSRLLPV